MSIAQRWPTITALGMAQTLAWASSYCLPAMLAVPMARDLGVSTPTIFIAFSLALIISALMGPISGRAIDHWGGRPVLMATNLVFSALVRLYGKDSRGAITGITLIAGFASTVGWPLSTLMEAQFGWRGACLGWAVWATVHGKAC